MRRSFLEFVARYCDPVSIGLIDALSLNVTADLGDETYDNLRRTGTIHIVSASGMHVTIIATILAWLLLLTPVPRWAQLCLLTGFLVAYAAAAGLNPPMIRAVGTVIVGSFAYAFAREPDPLSALSFIGLTTLMFEPEAVGSVGFLLSYLSVAGLVVFARLPSNSPSLKGRSLEYCAAAARASVVAWLATAPLLVHAFGQVSLVSLVANLLIVPTLAVVVAGSVLAWLSMPLLPIAVGTLKLVVEPLTGWILAVVETLGSWKWASVAVPIIPAWAVVGIYAVTALAYRPLRRLPEESTVW